MTKESAKLISIWTWVGLVLLGYGLIITAAGIYYAVFGLPETVLSHLNPSLWWGAFMVVSGVILLLIGRRAT
ncbi:MAG: hypothetical protein PVI01_05090 [Gemmatimonadales bacterium]|jgi:hypothetical protein